MYFHLTIYFQLTIGAKTPHTRSWCFGVIVCYVSQLVVPVVGSDAGDGLRRFLSYEFVEGFPLKITSASPLDVSAIPRSARTNTLQVASNFFR